MSIAKFPNLPPAWNDTEPPSAENTRKRKRSDDAYSARMDEDNGKPKAWDYDMYQATFKHICRWEGTKRRKLDFIAGVTTPTGSKALSKGTRTVVLEAAHISRRSMHPPPRILGHAKQIPWPMQKQPGIPEPEYRVRYWEPNVGSTRLIAVVVEPKPREMIPNPRSARIDDDTRMIVDSLEYDVFKINDGKAFPLFPSCDGTLPSDARANFAKYAGHGSTYWLDADEEMRAYISDHGVTDDIAPYLHTKSQFPASYKTENMSDEEFRKQLLRHDMGDRYVTLGGPMRSDEYNAWLLERIYVLREQHEKDLTPRYSHERVKDPYQDLCEYSMRQQHIFGLYTC